jgi:hypothetical protein
MIASVCTRLMRQMRLAAYTFAVLGGLHGNAHGVLVYHQDFNAGTGVPVVSSGDGVLAANAPGIFSTVGGLSGSGSLDNSAAVNGGTNGTGAAGTQFVGGSAISGLPNQAGGGAGNMNQFTIAFWYNPQSIRNSTVSRHHRLLVLGDSTAADYTTASGIGIALRLSGATSNPTGIDLWAKGISPAGVDGVGNGLGVTGTATTVGEWTFLALTYDGTSVNGNDSSVQNLATGGASSVNGQLYQGTATVAAMRFDTPFTVTGGDATAASLGAFNFGNDAKLFLANRGDAIDRVFDGFMDEIRIYDSVLSASEVETLRQSLAPVVPLSGDYNGNGKVDAADYVLWRKDPATFGGDPTGYDTWRANFGLPAGGGAALSAGAVPEPSTIALGGLVFTLIISGWRRK